MMDLVDGFTFACSRSCVDGRRGLKCVNWWSSTKGSLRTGEPSLQRLIGPFLPRISLCPMPCNFFDTNSRLLFVIIVYICMLMVWSLDGYGGSLTTWGPLLITSFSSVSHRTSTSLHILHGLII